jgi:hypothetical protein
MLQIHGRDAVVDVRTEAEVIARAIEVGALSVGDAVQWADGVIDREEHPHYSICDVALCARKYEPDVVAALREVPGAFDEYEVRRRVVQLLADGLERNRDCANLIARSLYELAMANNIDGDRLRSIAWWAWDGLDLADAGLLHQTRDEVIDELIAALREAADINTVR